MWEIHSVSVFKKRCLDNFLSQKPIIDAVIIIVLKTEALQLFLAIKISDRHVDSHYHFRKLKHQVN